MENLQWEDGIDDIQLSQHCDMVEMDYFMDHLTLSQTLELLEVDFNEASFDIAGTIENPEQLKQDPMDVDGANRFGTL